MTVYLHIGLHKTGTSSLQSFIATNREVFEAGGYAVPAAGWLDGAHHNIPLEILGKPKFNPALGGLEAALPQIDSRPNALLSSEEFEFLDLAGVRRLKQGLGDRPVKVIVYLRRQDALIASTYAQQIKMGARLGPFRSYVDSSLYHPRFDLFMLLMRWSHLFGREAVQTGVICAETSGDLLFDDFLAKLDAPDLAVARPDKLFNPSPSWGEVELLRRLCIQLKPRGRKFLPEELRRIKSLARRRVKMDGLDLDARLRLDAAELERVRVRFQHGNLRTGHDFIDSPVQREALMFNGEGRSQAPPAADDYFVAASAELASTLAREFAAGLPEAHKGPSPGYPGPRPHSPLK